MPPTPRLIIHQHKARLETLLPPHQHLAQRQKNIPHHQPRHYRPVPLSPIHLTPNLEKASSQVPITKPVVPRIQAGGGTQIRDMSLRVREDAVDDGLQGTGAEGLGGEDAAFEDLVVWGGDGVGEVFPVVQGGEGCVWGDAWLVLGGEWGAGHKGMECCCNEY